MINFALLGTGRIGKLHASIINAHPEASLKYVYDIDTSSAKKIAKKYSCEVAKTAKEAISSDQINAILIASATPTHTDYIALGAEFNKAILCEKPIDLDINKVNKCWQSEVLSGKIGNIEMIVITSRDPSPPGIDYLKQSGGIFRDCSIHDFDLARFILNNDPIVEVFAQGSVNVSNDFKVTNDYDTTMCFMKSKKGVLVHINNSRRAVYGYDQRLEVFGSNGMLISDNVPNNDINYYNQNLSFAKKPIKNFFIERYKDAYQIQLDQFIKSIRNKKNTLVTFEDGKNALILANSATKSVKSNKVVKPKF
jgi:myo-inositol 2-dehydrogenase/D-chiro-inositol 1-dehydrogenase